MELFNNREIATFIWISILLILALSRQSIRESILRVIKTFFATKISLVFVLAYLYIAGGIWLLYELSIWDSTTLKDSIIWSFTAASLTIFNIDKVKKAKNYFQKAVKDNLKFSLIVDFITGLYTFSLITELFLIPTMTFLALLLVVAERDTKHIVVKKLLWSIISLVGFIIIIYCIYKTIMEFDDFAKVDNLINFVLPIILAIWFLPFIYFLSLYMIYEAAFLSLRRTIRNVKLLRYAKVQAILRFRFDQEGFNRWKLSLFNKDIDNKQAALDSIAEIKERQKEEANPPSIDKTLGWSPFEAKDFLLPLDIETGYYQQMFDKNWFAISKPIMLDNGLFSNNLTYSVNGDRSIVKELTLNTKIYYTNENREAYSFFLKCVTFLFNVALGEELPLHLIVAIRKEKDIRFGVQCNTVILEWEKWPTGLGYSICFSIKHSQSELI